jgi:hypothetical protein
MLLVQQQLVAEGNTAAAAGRALLSEADHVAYAVPPVEVWLAHILPMLRREPYLRKHHKKAV